MGAKARDANRMPDNLALVSKNGQADASVVPAQTTPPLHRRETLKGISMTETQPVRIAGALLTVCAVGSLGLLAIHPSEGGSTFTELLRNEAASRLLSGAVHGGFIALMALELAAMAVLALRARRAPSVAGLALFALGVVALSASVLTDGLVLPAIAAKYVAVPAKVDFAKSLFVLCTSFIGVLMPIGLMLQTGGIALWGLGLAHDGRTRASGIIGILIGVLAGGAVGATGLNPVIVMAAIAAVGLWLAWLGILALRAKI